MSNSNRMTAHLWANQSESRGQSSNGNLYFEGDTIYSYGRHFPIARLVGNGRRGIGVLFTTRSHSVSTSRHCSIAWQAIGPARRENLFHVKNVTSKAHILHMKKDYKARQVAALQSYVTRKRDSTRLRDLQEAQGITDEANKFAQFFGLRARLKMPADIGKEVERLQRAGVRAEAEARRLTQQRLETERVVQSAQLAAWLEGEPVQFPSSYRGDGVRFRVRGDVLETSGGATVPLEQARDLILPRIIAARAAGVAVTYTTLLPAIGHFTVNSIDADGTLHAGCHVIPWPEIERIAKQIGALP